MPLETATYISQLVSTNPVHTDGLNAADAHMRLLKSVLQAQFPAFTAAALASSNAQLDAAVASVATNGIAILADAGAFFKTNSTTGFTNPNVNEVDVKIANVVVAQFLNTGFTIPGALNVGGAANAASASITGAASVGGNLSVTGTAAITGASTGPGHFPIGGSCQWWTDTLPVGQGTWAWLNGQAISRTTYSALFALWGTTYGAGDGSTTFNVPDTRDNALIGKGNMGGTGAVNRITNFVSTTLGNLFGECLHLLGIGEMPSHDHGGSTGSTDPSFPWDNSNRGAGGSFTVSNIGSGTTTQHLAHTHTISAQGGGASHNNVQPSIVCNHIVRIL